MSEITRESIVDMLVECGRVLDEVEVEQEGRYFLAPEWLFRKLKLWPAAPHRRGARGRKHALDWRKRFW